MTLDVSDRYAEYVSAFLEAFRLFTHYRQSDQEASDEASAHRAVVEVGLPTNMEHCEIVSALLLYANLSEGSPVKRREAMDRGYVAFLAHHA